MESNHRVIEQKHRNLTVDYLRGIAIFLVLVLHFHLAYWLDQSFLSHVLPASWIRRVSSNGNYGVTIFFVISGFLITSNILKRYGELAKVRLGHFYRFRVSRIFPNILLMLLIVSILGLAGFDIFLNSSKGPSFGLTIFSILTFWHNILMEQYGYFNYCLNILWSLSVEEVFYLGFPLMILILKKNKRIAIGLAIFICIGIYYRYQYRHKEIVLLYHYLSCFDAIAIGCLVALIKDHVTITSKTKKTTLTILSSILMSWVYLHEGILKSIMYGATVMSVGTGTILLLADTTQTKKRLFLSPLAWIGRLSYELYLFHVVVLALLKTFLPRRDLSLYEKPLLFVFYILISLLVSEAISRYYAEPMRRSLRNFKFKRDVS